VSAGKLFPAEVAAGVADRLMEALAGHAELLSTGHIAMVAAGSLRRGLKQVRDIDLVVIPKMTSKESLLGTAENVAETDFFRALKRELRETVAEGQKVLRGIALTKSLEQIGVDVYFATRESWATTLLIRTGSAMHNIWLCSRAIQCGGKLHADGSGLELAGQYDAVLQRNANRRIVRPETEEEIFKLLGIPYARPEERECVNGRPVWMSSARSNAADVRDAAAGER
jgi:DNA polymerase/3'-5' exonuclease PolX